MPATIRKITAVMARTKKDRSRIAKAGVETGAKMLGVGAGVIARPPLGGLARRASAASPCPAERSKARANAKRLVLLRPGVEFASFLRRVAKNNETGKVDARR